ncbi:MAG: acetoin utilization AcuB family protein [Ktedonobacteraceae bacterium]
MIVRDVMTTKLITVAPDDTLSHAANLLRQHQVHQLPVARTISVAHPEHKEYQAHETVVLLEGMLTSQDVDLAVALARQDTSNDVVHRIWQERHVVEVMHRAIIRVTPITSVAAVAQILVERGLNYLPVVEYRQVKQETQTILVGLLTRSDLLLALARSMGAFEPGMQLDILLPLGAIAPLVETLRIAAELHVQVRSIIAAPLTSTVPLVANLRIGTINPTALLVRLQEAGIEYSLVNAPADGELHG